MHLDNILTRLQLIHDEVAGLTAYKEPPTLFEVDVFPACYAVSLGFQENKESDGQSLFVYNVQVEVLVLPFKQGAITAQQTSTGTKAVHQWNETLANHYNTRRMLKHAGGAAFNHLRAPGIGFDSAGLVFPMSGPDGNLYFGTRFDLVIPMTVTYTPNR